MTSAEQIANGQFSSGLLLSLSVKLALVLALIYLSLYLLKRFGLERTLSQPILGPLQKHSEKPIKIQAIQALNRQSSLYLVEVNHKELLLSVAVDGRTQVLSEWPESNPGGLSGSESTVDSA